MKKLFFTAYVLVSSALVVLAQPATSFIGDWQGTLDAGISLKLVFHIKDNGSGGIKATADSPDQAAYGMKCDSVWVTDGLLTIEMRQLNASYKAKLVNDTTLDGVFKQGVEFPLQLTKTSVATATSERKRPQEPKPPFPYKTEDVLYDNASQTIRFGATITIPEGKGPFPAVLLITGSGPQNRDEEMLGHKPFAVLADYLTRNGWVVLRVDDRGVGKSTGRFAGATSADFADDARASFNYLLSRPEVNRKKAGLMGHSEGGMIAPMVAAGNKDVDFVVLLAGPGVKIEQLMTEQNVAILRQSGASEPAVQAYAGMYLPLCKAILAAKDSATAIINANNEVREWAKKTDPTLVNQLELGTPQSQEKLANGMTALLQEKWFHYFMAFDPTPYLESLSCKVLAINGTKDIQVIAGTNLAGIETALKKSKSKVYQTVALPGLNHLFQSCTTCSPAEYGQLEETFSPVALDEINKWLNKNVK